MKKTKLTLDALRVESFVTGLRDSNSKTAKGGVPSFPLCPVKTYNNCESFKVACPSQGAPVCSEDSC